MILKEYLRKYIDICIPKVCLLCGERLRKDEFICEECADFEFNIPPFCYKCGIGLDLGNTHHFCKRCLKTKFYFDKSFSPFLFKEPLSKLIHLFKYNGYQKLGEFLSKKFIRELEDSYIDFSQYDFITYIPLHKQKLRQREYNQSRILAKNIAKEFCIDTKSVLETRKYKKPQVTKDYNQRQTNLYNNFKIKTNVYNKRIILVDDVLTTGATLSECSRILKENKAKEVLALTLAIVK